MFKRIFIILFIICITVSAGYTNESNYSAGLSRLERAWLHKEYKNDDDEIRISRLEEKVFGTIHELDLKSRYIQLREAFDAQQRMKAKSDKSFFGGVPTSIPISVYDLYRGY